MSWLDRLFRNHRAAPPAEGRGELPQGTYRNALPIPEREAQADAFIRIVPVGSFPMHPDGSHEITREHLEQMVANFKTLSTDLLFDIDHESLWGSTRAAGWSSELEVRDDGLYARYPEFTPRGTEAVRNREYRYFSPVYVLQSINKRGEATGARLISVALTNMPYMDQGEIAPIGNSAPAAGAATGGTVPPSAPSGADHNPNEVSQVNREKLIQKLGLAADATDEQINAAIEALQPAASTAAPAATAEATPPPAPSEAVTVEALEARLRALETQAQPDAEALVNQAVTDGKIQPAEKTVWLNSARADYAGTKQALDGRKKNSALPAGVRLPQNRPTGQTQPATIANCAAYLRELRGR